MSPRTLVSALVGALQAVALRAQDPQDLAALLATSVAASSKREQPLIESPQAVEVLRGRDLRAMGIFRLADALKLMTDVDVLDYEGTAPILGLRGVLPQGSARMIQVLVDGVPLYNAENGGFDLDTLPVPLDLLDRVEVVRGPSSALYGANAVTGVLSLQTLRPEEGFHTSLRIARGSHTTSRWTASADWAAGPFALLGGLSGASYQSASAPSEFLSNGSPRTLEDERGHLLNGFLRAEWRLEGGTLWLATGQGRKVFGLSTGPSNLPGISNGPYYRDALTFAQAGWTEDWAPSLRTEFRLAQTHSENAIGPNPGLAAVFSDPGYLDPGGYAFDRYTNTQAEVQVNWTPDPKLKLVLGADARQDEAGKAHVIGLDADDGESASGVFVNLDGALSAAWNLNLGLRMENASLGGSRTSPRAVLTWSPAADSALRFGYYRSTRSPLILESRIDFTAILDPNPPYPEARIYPNPDLRPETVTSWEAGWRQGFGVFSVDLTLFRMRFDELIAQVSLAPPPPPPTVAAANTFVNHGTALDRGVELALTWIAGPGWTLGANGAYLDVQGPDGASLTYAPRLKANLWSRFTEGDFTGYLAFQYVSGVDMDVQPLLLSSARRTPREPIHQLHGQVSWHPGRGVEFGLYARNATRDLTPQGGSGFSRTNMLVSARREYGLSLGFRL